MASRYLRQFLFSFNAGLTYIEGNVVFNNGSGGMQSLKGSGVKSIVKASTGVYDINLDDSWARYLAGSWGFVVAPAATSGIHCVEVEGDPNLTIISATAPKVRIHMLDKNGALADPNAASVFGFTMTVRNSSVKGKGEV